MKLNLFYYLFLIIPVYHLIFFQIYKLNVNDSLSCLNKFKSNNFLGLLVFVNILIGKII